MCFPSTGPSEVLRLFLTNKSHAAIPVTDSVTHDALRQAALDPAVTFIEYVQDAIVGRRSVCLNAVLVVQDGARRIIDIYGAGCAPRTIDEEGLRLLAIDALDASPLAITVERILQEPRCTNARRVWTTHRRAVPLAARAFVLNALDREGALSTEELGLQYSDDVFALACQAVVDIDLDAHPIERGSVRKSIRHPSSPCTPKR